MNVEKWIRKSPETEMWLSNEQLDQKLNGIKCLISVNQFTIIMSLSLNYNQ